MSDRSLEALLAIASTKVDHLCVKLDEFKDELGVERASREALAARVTKLEMWRAFLAGAWAVVTAIGGYLLSRLK